MLVLENTEIDSFKTKFARKALESMGFGEKKTVLLIDGENVNANFERATWSLSWIHTLPYKGINVYDMLRNDQLVLTKSALDSIYQRFAKYRLQGH